MRCFISCFIELFDIVSPLRKVSRSCSSHRAISSWQHSEFGYEKSIIEVDSLFFNCSRTLDRLAVGWSILLTNINVGILYLARSRQSVSVCDWIPSVALMIRIA